MKPIRKAVLPVAGLGTRVLPATKAIPKEMLPVVDRPAVQYVVDEAREAGIEHIVFVTGRAKSAIEDYFDRAFELETILRGKGKQEVLEELTASLPIPGSMSFVRQQAPLGLGHAIWCARDIIGDEPFAVLLPDVLIQGKPGCLSQMVEAYNEKGGNIIAVDEVPNNEVNQYGVIDPREKQGRLIAMRGMVEKPDIDKAPSNLKITGRYILQPEILALLENQQTGAGGEVQLTDAMARLMQNQPFYAYEYEGRDFDCGNRLGYLRAITHYALTHETLAEGARALFKAALKEN
jgi:UTP--glucose-1-phosphate uridylyltransferase